MCHHPEMRQTPFAISLKTSARQKMHVCLRQDRTSGRLALEWNDGWATGAQKRPHLSSLKNVILG